MSIDARLSNSKNSSSAVLMLVFLLCIGFFSFLQLFCTPVMFPAIAKDLNLNTAQLGLIWGMATFGGLFFSLPFGMLGDRIGPRWSIFIVAGATAVILGLRGFARDTTSLAVLMFVGGGILGSIWSLAVKAIFTWFPSSRIGLANGMWSSFSRLGMAAGAGISVAVVSVLRSWQYTFFLYGSVLLTLAVLWLIIIREPPSAKSSSGVPFREALTHSIRTRDMWLCVIPSFGITGLNVVFSGYLPSYLQNIGWSGISSSLSLSVYLLSGVVGGIILLSLSDKMRLRKIIFIIPALIWIVLIGLFSVIKENTHLWILIISGGFAYGSLIALLNQIIAEIKGIGTRYAATANSIGAAISGAGGLIFATAGGHLALTNAILPFIYGPLICIICFVPFLFTSETGTRNQTPSL